MLISIHSLFIWLSTQNTHVESPEQVKVTKKDLNKSDNGRDRQNKAKKIHVFTFKPNPD